MPQPYVPDPTLLDEPFDVMAQGAASEARTAQEADAGLTQVSRRARNVIRPEYNVTDPAALRDTEYGRALRTVEDAVLDAERRHMRERILDQFALYCHFNALRYWDAYCAALQDARTIQAEADHRAAATAAATVSAGA